MGLAFGLGGIIWGTVLAYVACSSVPYLVNLRRLLARIEAGQAPASVSGGQASGVPAVDAPGGPA